ncbi:hypothetical protein FQR65_LT17768 [Abscondita terminalis]|nr:hypothetical protein FQR65_LT17768 [Abscondita terminalis]
MDLSNQELTDMHIMFARKRGNVILKDIKSTKDKVKERWVEEIIERENIYTIPNLLCVSRIAISPYLGLLIIQADFQFALAILDPMADKVLIATLFLSLTYAGLIPLALTGLIITRDALLMSAGFIIRYRSLPPPRTIGRYFDVTHATAQLAPTLISKINTGVQLLLVGSTLAAPVFHFVDHPMLQSLWYLTAVTTVAGG